MNIQPFLRLLQQASPQPINIKLEGDINLPELQELLSSIVKFNLNPERSNLISTFSIKARKLSIMESLRHGDYDTWKRLAIVVGVIGASILIGYGFKTWYNHEYGKAVQKIATGNWVIKDLSGLILRQATASDLMTHMQILGFDLGLMGVFANLWALLHLYEASRTTVTAELDIKPLSRTPLQYPKNARNDADTGWMDPNGGADILDSELNTPRCIHLHGYAIKSTSVLKKLLNANTPGAHQSPLFNSQLSTEEQRHLKTQIQEIFSSVSADIPTFFSHWLGETRLQGFLDLLHPNVYPLLRPEFDQELERFVPTAWLRMMILAQIMRF
ncbi:MAG: hypothetical protein EB051_02500 [Chlamydiia bacterium]|nr:hypothetical protein [Chlamydiia bacterium]